MFNGLVEYFRFDEASGDRTGSHAATVLADVNTLPSGAGKINLGLVCDTSVQYLEAATADVLKFGNEDFTVAGWISFSNLTDHHILGRWGDAGGREWIVYFATATQRFIFYVSGNGTAVTGATANTFGAPDINTLYFVLCEHDAANDKIRIQINNGTADEANFSGGVYQSTVKLRVGARSGATSTYPHGGVIDEVGFWNRLLTSDEKTRLYNGGAGLSYPFDGSIPAASTILSDAFLNRPHIDKFFLDCDLGSDCDDAGDHAMIHALMSTTAEIEMIAEITERTLQYSPGAIDAINTYYGRGTIPIGANKGDSFLPNDTYTQYLDENFTNDLDYAGAPEAVTLYRQTLAAQSSAIKILCTGPVRILYQVMISPADGISPLTGMELIASKVAEIIVVAGNWPTGALEYNLYQDPVAANYLFANCPVPLTIVGCEMGASIITGAGLTANTPESNPVRKAYEIHRGLNTGREAWAQLGVLYLARGLEHAGTQYYGAIKGTGSVSAADGSVSWVTDANGSHVYLYKVMADASFATLINALLEYVPG